MIHAPKSLHNTDRKIKSGYITSELARSSKKYNVNMTVACAIGLYKDVVRCESGLKQKKWCGSIHPKMNYDKVLIHAFLPVDLIERAARLNIDVSICFSRAILKEIVKCKKGSKQTNRNILVAFSKK